ncbi:hypothetical protein R6Q59_007106, partial [Mikania micrantha]
MKLRDATDSSRCSTITIAPSTRVICARDYKAPSCIVLDVDSIRSLHEWVVESSIHDPLVRYIHMMISCTPISCRAGAEKCNQLDLFRIYYMISRRPASLSRILLSSFARVRHGVAMASLDLGPYIGRIASRLGVFRRFPCRFLTL